MDKEEDSVLSLFKYNLVFAIVMLTLYRIPTLIDWLNEDYKITPETAYTLSSWKKVLKKSILKVETRETTVHYYETLLGTPTIKEKVSKEATENTITVHYIGGLFGINKKYCKVKTKVFKTVIEKINEFENSKTQTNKELQKIWKYWKDERSRCSQIKHQQLN